jgi:hypothetical protein
MTRYAPAPHYLVRVAGASIDALRRLRSPETVASIDRGIAAEERLAASRDAVADIVFDAVRRCATDAERRPLIGLKRDVFNLRDIDPEPLATCFGGDELARLRDWRDAVRDYRDAQSDGAAHFRDELAVARARLWDTVDAVHLPAALQASNPALYRLWEHRARNRGERHTKSERQLELTLATYLARMATRATPLSTLASVGYGFWTANGHVPSAAFSQNDVRTRFRFNRTMLRSIEAKLAAAAGIRPHLAPRVNPSLRVADGAAEWIRTVILNDENNAWICQRQRQSFNKVPLSPALARLLEIVDGVKSYAAVAEQLAAEGLTESAMRAAAFLDQLIEVQLLLNDFGVPDLSPQYEAELERTLRAIPDEFAQRTADLLARLDATIDQAARHGRHTAPAAILDVRNAAADLCRHAGLEVSAQHKNIVYQDSSVAFERLELPSKIARRAGDDAALWARIVSFFDLATVQDRLATAFFLEHHGADESVDLLDFYRQYLKMFREALPTLLQAVTNDDWRSISLHHFRQLEEIRRCQDRIGEFLQGQIAGAGDEVSIDCEALCALLDEIDLGVPAAPSVALLCQPISPDGSDGIVLLRALPGLGKCLSRFTYLFDDGGENALLDSIRRTTAQLADGEQLLADLGGVFGYNGNLRHLHTDATIEYPGTLPPRGAREVIKLHDLVLRYDAARHRLRAWSATLGREVVPVDLGFMFFALQPPLYQFLVQVSPLGQMSAPPLRALLAGTPQDVRTLPRVRLGSLVLQRRQWIFKPDAVPARQDNEDDFAYMARVRRWARSHALPEEVYVRTRPSRHPARELEERARRAADGAADAPSAGDNGRENGGNDLPEALYVDFANAFLVAAFRRLCTGAANDIVVEECLPSTDSLFARGDGERHVMELVIELVREEAPAS